MMIDRNTATGRSIGIATVSGAGLAAVFALSLLGAAQAAPVTFPKDHPVVVMDVPDGWSVDTTPTGLELQSPEKNSIIVAQIVTRDKPTMEAWARRAGERLKAFGVTFDEAAKPQLQLKPVTSGVNTNGLATNPNTFSFSGAPSLETPGGAVPNALASLGPSVSDPAKSVTPVAPKATAKLPFKSVEYLGTSVKGQKVDAELVIFPLSAKQVLLLMQESGPDDNRSGGIARSVAMAK